MGISSWASKGGYHHFKKVKKHFLRKHTKYTREFCRFITGRHPVPPNLALDELLEQLTFQSKQHVSSMLIAVGPDITSLIHRGQEASAGIHATMQSRIKCRKNRGGALRRNRKLNLDKIKNLYKQITPIEYSGKA